jgi:hypothetical protein
MLSVAFFIVMLCVIMLSVVMLNVVMLSVVAPLAMLVNLLGLQGSLLGSLSSAPVVGLLYRGLLLGRFWFQLAVGGGWPGVLLNPLPYQGSSL